MPVTSAGTFYRLIFRIQLPSDGLSIVLSASPATESLQLTDFRAYRETERCALIHRGVYTSEISRGAVTFDVIH